MIHKPSIPKLRIIKKRVCLQSKREIYSGHKDKTHTDTHRQTQTHTDTQRHTHTQTHTQTQVFPPEGNLPEGIICNIRDEPLGSATPSKHHDGERDEDGSAVWAEHRYINSWLWWWSWWHAHDGYDIWHGHNNAWNNNLLFAHIFSLRTKQEKKKKINELCSSLIWKVNLHAIYRHA